MERVTIKHTRTLAEKLNPSQSNRTGVLTLKFRKFKKGMIGSNT